MAGCAAQLKPGEDVSKYFVIPGTTFVPTLLCGVSSGAEACLRMQDGEAVKSVINSSFKSWLANLESNEQVTTQAGKTAYSLNLQTGDALLKALIADNKIREQIRRQKYDDKE